MPSTVFVLLTRLGYRIRGPPAQIDTPSAAAEMLTCAAGPTVPSSGEEDLGTTGWHASPAGLSAGGPGRGRQQWDAAVLCLLQPLPSARSIPREFTPAPLRLISSATGCQCCLVQLQVGKSRIFRKGEKMLLSEYRRLDVVFFSGVGY